MAEKWGRRYRVTHLWREVRPFSYRSRCGQRSGSYKPDGDDREPRCLKCVKSLMKSLAAEGGEGL